MASSLLNIVLMKFFSISGIDFEKINDESPIIYNLFGGLKETESLSEAGTWVEAQVTKFGINFNQIAKNLNLMWEELSIWNSMNTNVAIFKKYVSPWLNKFLNFSSIVNEKVKALRLEGAPAPIDEAVRRIDEREFGTRCEE